MLEARGGLGELVDRDRIIRIIKNLATLVGIVGIVVGAIANASGLGAPVGDDIENILTILDASVHPTGKAACGHLAWIDSSIAVEIWALVVVGSCGVGEGKGVVGGLGCAAAPILDTHAPDFGQGAGDQINLGNGIVFLQGDPGCVAKDRDRFGLKVLGDGGTLAAAADADALQVEASSLVVEGLKGHGLDREASASCCGRSERAGIDHRDRARRVAGGCIDHLAFVSDDKFLAITVEAHRVRQGTHRDLAQVGQGGA